MLTQEGLAQYRVPPTTAASARTFRGTASAFGESFWSGLPLWLTYLHGYRIGVWPAHQLSNLIGGIVAARKKVAVAHVAAPLRLKRLANLTRSLDRRTPAAPASAADNPPRITRG
jgi:hypothetical protein